MTSLLDLPTELLEAICHQLRSPFTLKGFLDKGDWRGEYPWGETPSPDLSRLSRTCSVLRDIAQPLSYRAPMTKMGLVSLARTLIQRPDLAVQVMDLEVGGINQVPYVEMASKGHIEHRNEVYPPDDTRLFDSTMQHHSRSNGGDSPVVSCNWLRDDPQDENAYEPMNFLAVLLLQECVNLRRFCVVSYYFHDFPFYGAGKFAHLTELTLWHSDQEGTSDIRILAGILAAAPALKILNGHMLSGGEVDTEEDKARIPLVSESIVDCSFLECRFSLELLEEVMRGFPNLQSYYYVAGQSWISNMSEPTPREVSECLLLRKSTLQHVSIETLDYLDHYGLTHRDLMSSLKGMDVLQTLKVDGCALSNGSLTSLDSSFLTDFLPASIESFEISGPGPELVNPIFQLAAVAPEQFPRLRKVTLRYTQKARRGTFDTAFIASGIELVTSYPAEVV